MTGESIDDVGDDESAATQQPYGHLRVYFVRDPTTGLIKIGCTRRMRFGDRYERLVSALPGPVEVLGLIPGDIQLERTLHIAFAPSWHHNEWFEPTPELMEFIQRVAKPWDRKDLRDIEAATRKTRDKLMAEHRKYYPATQEEARGKCTQCGRLIVANVRLCRLCHWVEEDALDPDYYPGYDLVEKEYLDPPKTVEEAFQRMRDRGETFERTLGVVPYPTPLRRPVRTAAPAPQTPPT